jgi:hypothetical protein
VLDDLRRGERLAATGDAEQGLVVDALPVTSADLLDGARLIAFWRELGDNLEFLAQ